MDGSFNYFENTRYINNRNRKKTLILDIDSEDQIAQGSHIGSDGKFDISLNEPMLIDKHSEVYLDNFTTFNSNIASNTQQTAFVLKINEFDINTNVASSSSNNIITNSILIPNEHKNASLYHTPVIHKGKKFNYICDINPKKIHSLSGSITDLKGDPVFHHENNTDRVTYSLIGINTNDLSIPGGAITEGTSFKNIYFNIIDDATTGITLDDNTTIKYASGSNVEGTFPVLTGGNSTIIHFTTSENISSFAGQQLNTESITTSLKNVGVDPGKLIIFVGEEISFNGNISEIENTEYIVTEPITYSDSSDVTALNNALGTTFSVNTLINEGIIFEANPGTNGSSSQSIKLQPILFKIKKTTGSSYDNLSIIEGHARFIAEFSIISRE